MRNRLAAIWILALLCGAVAEPAAAGPACLGARDPSAFVPCVRQALRDSDPDVRADALRAFVGRQAILVIVFETAAQVVETEAALKDGRIAERDLTGTYFNLRRFDEAARNKIALQVDGVDDSGAIRLTVRDFDFRQTKSQIEIEAMSHGTAQVAGGRFRAAFRYTASTLSLRPQCTFDGALSADGDALVGTLSCIDVLPATPARIALL